MCVIVNTCMTYVDIRGQGALVGVGFSFYHVGPKSRRGHQGGWTTSIFPTELSWWPNNSILKKKLGSKVIGSHLGCHKYFILVDFPILDLSSCIVPHYLLQYFPFYFALLSSPLLYFIDLFLLISWATFSFFRLYHIFSFLDTHI